MRAATTAWHGIRRPARWEAAGAVAAGTTASAAPLLDKLQANVEETLVKQGMNSGAAKMIAQGGEVTSASMGAVVGGIQGAGTGLAVDTNNRQLHPKEVDWIKQNAKRFAQQQGISEQEAERRLAQQAFREV